MPPCDSAAPAPPSEPGRPADVATLLAQRDAIYLSMRHSAAMAILFAAPVVMMLPPRKLDVYTAGLAFSWVFCLNEVANQRFGGGGIVRLLAERRTQEDRQRPGEKERAARWRGADDDVHAAAKYFRNKEEQGKPVGEIMAETVRDVWKKEPAAHDHDKSKTPAAVVDDDGALPLSRTSLKYESERREKTQNKAVEDSSRST